MEFVSGINITVPFILSAIYVIYVIVLTIKIILDNRHPTVTIGWLLAIILLPYVGVIFYILGGTDWKKRKIVKFRPEEIFKEETHSIIRQQKLFVEHMPPDINNDAFKAILLNINSSGAVISLKNKCDFMFSGREIMDQLIRDLSEAKDFIHMEFFIWRSDRLGKQIASILLEKVKQGVDVRLIFDGVGCFLAMSQKYKRTLRKGGVKYRYFLDPLNPFFGRLLNYRNHRKIVVIDGRVAYTGGVNIGQEYIDGGRRFDYWRDTAIRISGESVQFLELVFLSDWGNSGASEENPEKFLIHHEEQSSYLPMQIVCSGPDSDWNSLELFIFNIICNANREVIIQSPYFIPNESLLAAMETAAMGGVRVRIMMTGVADKHAPFWAAQTYFEEILKAGVELYLYEKGFLHAKMYIADDNIASVGTCNLDIRSLRLHYEVNSVFYDEDAVRLLRKCFEEDIKDCRKISLANIRRRNFFFRLRDSFFRIISPVL